jgi:hypothetical protein
LSNAERQPNPPLGLGLCDAAARIPENELLEIQNRAAEAGSDFRPGTEYDMIYTRLPRRNVINTHIGYELYQSGRIGPDPIQGPAR